MAKATAANTEKFEVKPAEIPAEYDPWQDMREVYIPKRSRGEMDTQEVGVNNRTFFVPKDKRVTVPLPVAEVVEEMLYRQKIMEDNAKKNSGAHEFNV